MINQRIKIQASIVSLINLKDIDLKKEIIIKKIKMKYKMIKMIKMMQNIGEGEEEEVKEEEVK